MAAVPTLIAIEPDLSKTHPAAVALRATFSFPNLPPILAPNRAIVENNRRMAATALLLRFGASRFSGMVEKMDPLLVQVG